MERSEHKEAGSSSPAGPQFDYLANSLAQLLEAARRELDHDRQAAKASLATASSILQSEIERRACGSTNGTRALVGWQIARVRAFIEKNLDRPIHTRDLIRREIRRSEQLQRQAAACLAQHGVGRGMQKLVHRRERQDRQ